MNLGLPGGFGQWKALAGDQRAGGEQGGLFLPIFLHALELLILTAVTALMATAPAGPTLLHRLRLTLDSKTLFSPLSFPPWGGNGSHVASL